jgi:hypothetical protein
MVRNVVKVALLVENGFAPTELALVQDTLRVGMLKETKKSNEPTIRHHRLQHQKQAA